MKEIPEGDKETFDRFVAELDKADAADRESALSSWDSLKLWAAENFPGAVPMIDQLVLTAPALLQVIANLVR